MKTQNLIPVILIPILLSCSKIEGPWAELYLEHPEKGFVSEEPANWIENCLITGNGTIGALVPGNVEQDKILFSHERAYCPVYKPMTPPPVWKHLDRYRNWISELDGEKAVKYIWDIGQEMGYPDPIWWTDFYLPTGYLVFDIPGTHASGGYARSTDWETGLTTVAWNNGHDVFHRNMFVSRPDGISVMLVESPTGAKIDCNIWHEQLEVHQDPDNPTRNDEFFDENIKVVQCDVDGDMLRLKMTFKKEWEGSLKVVNMVTKVIPIKGEISLSGDRLEVEDASKVLLLTVIEPDFKSADVPLDPLYAKLDGIRPDFNQLLSKHAAIHGEMLNRVELTLDSPPADTVSVETLRETNTLGQVEKAYIQKLFYAMRYAAISSNGEWPPNLKGIWATRWRSGWSGDFTQDGNIQSAVQAGLSGNHFEIVRSYLDYMSGFLDDFRANARELFNMEGIWVPSKTSTSGRVYHFSYRTEKQSFPGLFWPAGAAWTAQHYYDYWLYTGDKTFLNEQAIPFMDESAKFYEQYLYEHEGKLIVNPSYSPEIYPVGIKTTVIPNATMDVASIKQLMRNMLTLAGDGLIDPGKERIETWERILRDLPAYAVGENGALREWIWPGAENNEAHRHCSHLYPLYYELDPEIDTSDVLRAASAQAIENRMAWRRPQGGGSMSFGVSLLGVSAAHLGNSDQAYEILDLASARYFTGSLMSAVGPSGRNLNADIVGGYQSLIIDMLMYSRNEFVELLPALPEQWIEGKITGLRAKGGFEVDVYWKDGQLKHAEFTSLLGNPLKVKYGDKFYQIDISEGEKITFRPK